MKPDRFGVLRERLTETLAGRVRFGVNLARYTSFRIGGPADILVEPNTVAELHTLRRLLVQEDVPFLLLGGGTNVLVSDKGVRGVVVRLGRGFNYVRWPGAVTPSDYSNVRVGARRSLGHFVRETFRRGLGGIEFAEGIPGTIGGGLLMNAGAFGGELSQVIVGISGVTNEGDYKRWARNQICFNYRETAFPAKLIVTEAEFGLSPKTVEEGKLGIEDFRKKRNRTQPRGYPNAGSVFKNPPGTHAGKIIEALGWKGRTEGAAQVSGRHANFILNMGGATASQVWNLVKEMQDHVWKTRKIWLEPEIRRVGEW